MLQFDTLKIDKEYYYEKFLFDRPIFKDIINL